MILKMWAFKNLHGNIKRSQQNSKQVYPNKTKGPVNGCP